MNGINRLCQVVDSIQFLFLKGRYDTPKSTLKRKNVSGSQRQIDKAVSRSRKAAKEDVICHGHRVLVENLGHVKPNMNASGASCLLDQFDRQTLARG